MIWQAIVQMWHRLWRRDASQGVSVTNEEATIKRVPKKAKADHTKVVNREDEGAHFYLRDILTDIRRCHKMLRRLRRVDKEAANFHGRIGARLLPEASMTGTDLPAHLPAFGMTYFPGNRAGEGIVPARFMFFTRAKNPIGLQPFKGPVYRVAVVYADEKLIHPASFHVGIDSDTVRPLRAIQHRRVLRRHMVGTSSKARVAGSSIETLAGGSYWGLDRHLLDIWNDPVTQQQHGAKSMEQWLTEIVAVSMNAWAIRADDELQVRVRRGRATALFNVSTRRTPYFFRDRDTTVAKDGKRKRIFHIVRSHQRELATGHITTVKEHYRGERRFTWDGADVTITVPNLHHAPITTADLEAIQREPGEPAPLGTISNKKAGKLIAEHMS